MDTVNWKGVSGATYSMQICTFGIAFKETAGVYVFCYQGTDQLWYAVYVGECENFNDRLNLRLEKHHRWDCIKRHGATRVCCFPVSGGKSARTAVETDIRQLYDPPCNRQ